MASEERGDLFYPGVGGSNVHNMMSASAASDSSTLSALATGEHNVGASSSQVKLLSYSK